MFNKKKGIVLVLALVLSLSIIVTGCTTKVTNTTSTNERGYSNPTSLMTAAELKEAKDVVIIDFTKSGGDYIPGAVRIDRDAVATEVNGVSGMLISKAEMEAVLSKAGIKNDDKIVIYDGDKSLWAARLWWGLKVYGHEDVRLLDGGIDAWKSAGYETEKSPATLPESNYKAKDANEAIVADIAMIETSFNNDKLVVLDTRAENEWKDGRIPGAVWIEWTKALNDDGTFKNADELKELYESNGITKDKESIMAHCQGAVRSANTMFVLQELLGYKNVRNYDGSWAEYGKSGKPIDK